MKRCFFVAFLFMLSTSLFSHDELLSAFLLGEEEVPGPGDLEGFGQVTLLLKPRAEQICFLLTVENIATPTAAHIHEGEFGVAGPVVVTLITPVDGSSGGCLDVNKALIRKIKKNPEDYYVNVHNADFPSGALRGQLECEDSDS